MGDGGRIRRECAGKAKNRKSDSEDGIESCHRFHFFLLVLFFLFLGETIIVTYRIDIYKNFTE